MLPTANGKVIIFGEHAVVYGNPALAIGIPDALEAILVETNESIEVQVTSWNLKENIDSQNTIGQALLKLKSIFPEYKQGFKLVAKSSIPLGAGLGSSAALSVLLVKSFSFINGKELSLFDIRKYAHELENVFHGNASGLDDTVATYGGMILFNSHNYKDLNYLETTIISNNIHQLHIDPPPLVICDSKVERKTKKMVENVRKFKEKNVELFPLLLLGFTGCVNGGITALLDKDNKKFGDSLTSNQRLLNNIKVGHKSLDSLVLSALDAGALGAKLTGAGGGGCVIAYAPSKEKQIMEKWLEAGFESFVINQR